MLNKMLRLVRQYAMLEPGDRLTCAVSGGADSVALLYAMFLLKDKLQITLEAAHFDHGLRGEESHRDAEFVRRLCDRLDIPLTLGAGEIVSGSKGLEAAARDARYAFFATLPGKLATAHTADDNAETVLMRLVRGTGLKGLGAISPVRGSIIRPMLTVTRQEVLSFLQEHDLSYVTDSSNASDDFLRNRLRHHVMPLLKRENPRLAENLSAMALRLRQDEQALHPNLGQGSSLDVETVLALHPAVRSRVLADFLERCGVREPESAHLEALQALLEADNPSARISLPGGVVLRRQYGAVIAGEQADALEPVVLECPGRVELPGLLVTCEPAQSLEQTPDSFAFHPDGKILVRCRQQGDSIRLSGGTKSLKKLFIDRKIPAADRSAIPVIADDSGLVGVYGIGADVRRAAKELPAARVLFLPKDKNQT